MRRVAIDSSHTVDVLGINNNIMVHIQHTRKCVSKTTCALVFTGPGSEEWNNPRSICPILTYVTVICSTQIENLVVIQVRTVRFQHGDPLSLTSLISLYKKTNLNIIQLIIYNHIVLKNGILNSTRVGKRLCVTWIVVL